MQELYAVTAIPNPKIKHLKGAIESLGDEMWANDTYTVIVKRNQPTGLSNEGKPVTMCWLSIRRNDRQAKPDWRDFQWIKNQLVGPENEGCELFPAESRLVDGANQFHLWVFEDPTVRFPFGFTERCVVDGASIFGETQRKFPSNRIPPDLAENRLKIEKMVKQASGGNRDEFKNE